jgi:hypothetical protein
MVIWLRARLYAVARASGQREFAPDPRPIPLDTLRAKQ